MRRAAWAILILLILAGAWFFAFRGGAEPVARAPAPPARPVDLPAAAPPPAAAPAPQATSEPAPEPPAAEPTLRRWLEGTVRFADGEPTAGARLRVVGIRAGRAEMNATGVTGADGSFQVDLSLRPGQHPRVLGDVTVRVEHPDVITEAHRFRVPPEALDPEQPVVSIPVALVLHRAVVVSGRVVDVRGTPLRGAEVVAIVTRERFDGGSDTGLKKLIDSTTSGPDGTFTLRVDAAAVWWLAADLPGKRASFRDFEGVRGAIPDVVLEDAAAISGTVADAAGSPVAGVRVRAEPADQESRPLARGMGGRLERNFGSFLKTGQADAEVETAADGSFTLLDLDPGPHRVTVESIGEVEVLADAIDHAALVVPAPSGRVGLRLDLVRVRIEVRVDDGPLPASAALHVMSRHRRLVEQSIDVPAGGVVEVIARPGAKYEVDLQFRQVRFDMTEFSIPDGERTARVRLDFRSPAPRESLRVIASGTEGVPTRAGFGLFDPEEPEGLVPDIRRDVVAKDGQYLLTDVPAGRWRLVVRAGGGWNGGEGCFLDETVDVEVPTDGCGEARVTLRPGGRIRIDARGPENEFAQVDCTVEDARGRPVETIFEVAVGEGRFVGRTGGLVPRGENVVLPALPEGTYTLRFSGEGFAPRNESVRVRAGETTRVAVVLDRAR